MTPLRLDRAAVVARLDGEIYAWVQHELLDAFEPAMLASLIKAPKAGRKGRSANDFDPDT